MTLNEAILGIFITLNEPTKDMIKTAKEAGIYQSKFMSNPVDKINIVTVKEIIEEENKEIVSLEVEKPQKEHSWLKFAGMFKDDPLFDEMLDFIAEERLKENQELEAEYLELHSKE